MSGEIENAAAKLRERVDVSGALEASIRGAGKDEAEDILRRIYSGSDLDFEELHRVVSQRRIQAQMAILLTSKPGVIAATFFGEGLVTGLLIAEARAREEARS